MTPKRARGRAQPKAQALDMGPAIRVARGDVEVVDRPDPDRPQGVAIRGAKARCHYDVLWRKGGLTDAEREAADRYAVLCEMEAGARERPGQVVGRLPPWLQGQPTLTQVEAAVRLRRAHGTVGNDATALLRLYVRDNLPAGEIGRRRQETEAAVVGRIKAALTRLAELWGM